MFVPVKKDDTNGWKIYAADFETTTSSWRKDQTKVWSFCIDEVGRYHPEIFGSIEDFFLYATDYSRGLKKRIYFHNLKFDGNFILYYLLNEKHFRIAIDKESGQMAQPEKIVNGEMVYVIADSGQWYYLAFKWNNVLVEVRDSLKILPFTLKQIGDAFCSKYKKSQMDYDNKTSLADCTPEDIEYIKNDVLVLSEGLSFIMKRNGEESPFKPVTSLTIGSACLARFKETIYGESKSVFVKLDEQEIESEGIVESCDKYIRRGYRGGFCYVNEAIEGKTLNQEGFTADVNSLYPFAMCFEYSGNRFPIGKPTFALGRPPKEMLESDSFYFYCRVKVAFTLKQDYVPTIQKKNSLFFLKNAYLKSSRIQDLKTGCEIGRLEKIDLTLSKDDLIVFLEHYNIISIEWVDYLCFKTRAEIFDFYIREFAKIKQESKGATRSLAKLFSNNLYGQMSKSENSSFKVAKIADDGSLTFSIVPSYEKSVVNIAIGAAITAKARRYQIETIQNNFSRFCYSDTDSLHCIGKPEDFVGKVDNKIYGAYKIESEWKRARFVRQKTYIEEFKDGTINICCAGMTDKQKQTFREQYDFEDFKEGLTIKGGKLAPKYVKGGVILEEVDFTLR